MRRKRREPKRFFRAMLAVSAGAAVLIIVFTSSVFDVKDVVVIGNSAVSAREVRIAAGLGGSVNIFALNAAKAGRGLAALPYIAAADVTKEYPGTVYIRVRERRACGYVDHRPAGVYILVDDEGVALEAQTYMKQPLPVITGLAVEGFTLGKPIASGNDSACKAAFEIVRLLAPCGLEEAASRLDVTDPDDARLFCGQIDVALGAGQDLNSKLQDLKSILDSGNIPEGVRCVVDMRGGVGTYTFQYVK